MDSMRRLLILQGIAALSTACGGGGGGGGGGASSSASSASSSQSSVTGSGWTSPALIDDASSAGLYSLTLARTSDDTLLAAWLERDATTLFYDLMTAVHTASTGWQAPTIRQSNIGSPPKALSMVPAGAGEVWLGWLNHSAGTKGYWGARFQTATGWGGATLLESASADASNPPLLAGSIDGCVVMAWVRGSIGAVLGGTVWAKRYAPASGWSAATRVDEDFIGSERNASGVRVSMNTSGRAMVVWQHVETAGPASLISYSVCSSAGVWGGMVGLQFSTYGDLALPEVLSCPNGDQVVVWLENGGSGTLYNVKARRMSAAGAWTGSTVGGWSAGTVLHGQRPCMVSDASSNVSVMWFNYGPAETHVWAARYSSASVWSELRQLDAGGGLPSLPNVVIAAHGNQALAAVWSQGGALWCARRQAATGWGAGAQVLPGVLSGGVMAAQYSAGGTLTLSGLTALSPVRVFSTSSL